MTNTAGAAAGSPAQTGGAGASAGSSGAPTGGSSTAGSGGLAGSEPGSGGAAGNGGDTAVGGGTGGGATLELEQPIERNGKYTLEFGDVVFTADPAVGARVTAFSFKGTNLLTTPAQDKSGGEPPNNYGSTFWPSPQTKAVWGGETWPPIPEIDSGAYTPMLDGTTIVLTSAKSVRGSMSLTKRFSAVLNAQAVDLTYTLKNENSASVTLAPWQISRVAPSGITFFPTGERVVPVTDENGGQLDLAKITSAESVTWYKNTPGDEGKYIADGAEGWLAHVSGDLLFVKRFPDVKVAETAPNEGDAEIYAGKGYVEIEAQGPVKTLATGASLEWTVRWYVRKLPDPTMASVGNAALVALVRETIQQ